MTCNKIVKIASSIIMHPATITLIVFLSFYAALDVPDHGDLLSPSTYLIK